MKKNYEEAKLQNDSDFKRDTGISRATFDKIAQLVSCQSSNDG